MNISAIISGLIGGAIAVALTTYVAQRVGKTTVPGQLRFGWVMWLLAVACLGFSLLPVVMTVLGNDKEFGAKAALFIGFGTGAFYCFGEAASLEATLIARGSRTRRLGRDRRVKPGRTWNQWR
jgi:hypothetical protein